MIAIKSLYAPVVGRLPLAGEKASGDSALFVSVIRHAFTAFAVSRAGIGAGAGACVVAVGHSLLLARGSAFFDYAAFCGRCQRPPFSTRRGRTLFSYPAASPCKHDGGSAVIFLVFALESSRLYSPAARKRFGRPHSCTQCTTTPNAVACLFICRTSCGRAPDGGIRKKTPEGVFRRCGGVE